MNSNKRINISSGISPIGTSKKVKAAIRKAIKGIKNHPDHNCTKLIRIFLSKYGIPENSVLFANSIAELIYLIPAVVQPKKVLIAGPAIRIYEYAAIASGAEILYCNADEKTDFVIDIEALREKTEGVDILFIANPNRVTGKLINRESLHKSLIVPLEGKVRIVIDETLVEFAGDSEHYKDISKRNNLIILRTTANFYGLPGLELAYAVSSPETMMELKNKKHWDVNSLAVEAAKTAFKDKVYGNLARQYINREKKLFERAFKKNSNIKLYNSDSNVILFRLDTGAAEILNALSRAGFSIDDYSDIEGVNSSFLRFSVLKHEDNLKFIKILNSCLFP